MDVLNDPATVNNIHEFQFCWTAATVGNLCNTINGTTVLRIWTVTPGFNYKTELSHQTPLRNKTAVSFGYRSDMPADTGEMIEVCRSTFCSDLFLSPTWCTIPLFCNICIILNSSTCFEQYRETIHNNQLNDKHTIHPNPIFETLIRIRPPNSYSPPPPNAPNWPANRTDPSPVLSPRPCASKQLSSYTKKAT
jgi:hypothetical protein